MSRAEANKEYNTFVAGLQTEASPLTFPENSSLDEENFVLSVDGSRQRRLGIDYETGFVLKDTGFTPDEFAPKAISVFEWKNVNDDPKEGILVIQIGSDLYFYDLFAAVATGTPLNGGAPVILDNPETEPVQFTAVVGRLVAATGDTRITILEYDVDTDTILTDKRNMYIRDIFGVDDELGTVKRPVNLTDKHKYNLFNQGWTIGAINTFKNSQGVFPSHADIQHLGKDENEDFDAEQLVKQDFGNAPAAKGRNILNAFTRGASRTSGGQTPVNPGPFEVGGRGRVNRLITDDEYQILENTAGLTLPVDSTSSGVVTVAHFAGRVWYAGAASDVNDGDSKSPHLGSYVFFSQIVENVDKINLCYQEGDPTAEHNSELVDSDGGVIKITEARGITRIEAISTGLAVFATNGVWQIVGTSDAGFSATGFAVIKVSDVGVVSPRSIVAVDTTIFYWAKSGIFVLQPDEISGRLIAQSISRGTIQSLYNDIAGVVKNNVVGTYDPASSQVRWLYTDSLTYDGDNDRYEFDKELVFDTTLTAFWKTSIKTLDTSSPFAAAYINQEDIVTEIANNQIVSDGFNVVSLGQGVVEQSSIFSRGVRSIKYLTIVPGDTMSFTASTYNDTDFLDWKTRDNVGKDAAAFLLTGFDTFQDTQRWKKVTFLTTHMAFTETGFDANLDGINPSGCFMQAQWEWANSANSGRWSRTQQIYRLKRLYLPVDANDDFDFGFDVVTTRNKIRGKGRALSLLFTSEAGKDCHLLGWGLNVTGETEV